MFIVWPTHLDACSIQLMLKVEYWGLISRVLCSQVLGLAGSVYGLSIILNVFDLDDAKSHLFYVDLFLKYIL